MVTVSRSQINTIIRVRRLEVRYGAVVALKDVSFDIRTGEFISIVGPSGCGKTSLLNVLAGFMVGTGEVEVRGRVGIVFQEDCVFPWMTVAENIAFGLPQTRDRNQTLQHYLTLIGMQDRAHYYPPQLSGGQIQRVGIARAFAADPAVILMDEPFGSLDSYTRDKMQEWLLRIWMEHHKTVLLVTHDIEEAIFLSDRVFVLGYNRVLCDYSIKFRRPRLEDLKYSSEFVYLKKEILDITRASSSAMQNKEAYEAQPPTLST